MAAFVGIMCTEAEIDQRSGEGVSANFTSDMKTAACLAAESTVNVLGRHNFSDSWGTLNVDVKYLLTDIVASQVAMQAILYSLAGYSSRIAAEDAINVLRDVVLRGLSILRDKKAQDFVNAA